MFTPAVFSQDRHCLIFARKMYYSFALRLEVGWPRRDYVKILQSNIIFQPISNNVIARIIGEHFYFFIAAKRDIYHYLVERGFIVRRITPNPTHYDIVDMTLWATKAGLFPEHLEVKMAGWKVMNQLINPKTWGSNGFVPNADVGDYQSAAEEAVLSDALSGVRFLF